MRIELTTSLHHHFFPLPFSFSKEIFVTSTRSILGSRDRRVDWAWSLSIVVSENEWLHNYGRWQTLHSSVLVCFFRCLNHCDEQRKKNFSLLFVCLSVDRWKTKCKERNKIFSVIFFLPLFLFSFCFFKHVRRIRWHSWLENKNTGEKLLLKSTKVDWSGVSLRSATNEREREREKTEKNRDSIMTPRTNSSLSKRRNINAWKREEKKGKEKRAMIYK